MFKELAEQQYFKTLPFVVTEVARLTATDLWLIIYCSDVFLSHCPQ